MGSPFLEHPAPRWGSLISPFPQYEATRNIMPAPKSAEVLAVEGLTAKMEEIRAFVAGGGLALAPLASPAFTGVPTAPTAAPGTNTAQLATAAFVQAALTALLNGAPGALDTLKELADALGDDANYAATITGLLALKAPLASPALTGSPTAPTAAPGDSSTLLATTAFIQAAIALARVPFPGYQSGVYTTGRFGFPGSINTLVLAANTLYFFPLWLDGAESWTKLAINVTATGAGANAHLGLCSSSAGLPNALIVDAGVVSIAGTGVKEAAITQTLPAALYYGALVADGAATVSAANPANSNASDGLYHQMLGATSFAATDTQLSKAFTYGVLSGAFPLGALTRSTGNIPLLALKK